MDIDFKTPASWSELSDSQMMWLLSLHTKEFSSDDIKVHAWLKFSGTRLLAKAGDGKFLVKYKGEIIELTPLQVGALMPFFDWAATVPAYPARPSRLLHKNALPADFMGVPFGSYIQTENLYQGYLTTRNEDILDELLKVLYPDIRLKKGTKKLSVMRLAAFYWVCGLKTFFARKFPNFFRPVSENDTGNLLGASPQATPEETMNAQIRALTKGDVTKEAEILELDTWRALAELDAQAKEYRQLKDKLNETK